MGQFRTICFCSMFSLASTAGNAQERTITVHPETNYSVDGLAIGAPVAPTSSAYHKYSCKPSDQYPNLTRCHETHNENGVLVSRTILHAPNLLTWYVNKELSPAYFRMTDVDMEINRLSGQFGGAPRIYRLNERNGFPKATIAIFGGVELEPLKADERAMLTQGKSPRVGILIDFLNDFHQSAMASLPVYKLEGSAGFAWIANYDRQGKGTLRFFAADASQMRMGSDEREPQGLNPRTNLAPITVAMESVRGVYEVPIRLNDTITLDAIVDSGASDVSLPADVVLTLIRSKTISPDDFIGSKTYVLADGSEVPSQRFIIRSVKVGSKTLENVIAGIGSVDSQILLGQSFLSRFTSWSVDNRNHTLVLN
ncbi:MAG TPA: retropepsin-like aspartic protease [Methylocella sp.]|nr:retropepsin-like aspartic protease [Methylocella sp.]